MSEQLERAAEQAIQALQRAGASQGDARLTQSEGLEVRVRGEEIDFVKQAHAKGLVLRAFVEERGGRRQASTSTSDLTPEAVDRMAQETVALARATAVDPAAGLPEGGFASDWPDLELLDPADRPWKVDEWIERARRAEDAARALDARITRSSGSQASSRFACVAYGNTAGFVGSYASSSHGLYSMPVAEADGQKQTDYWSAASRSLSGLEDPESVGRSAGERVVRRLGARPVPTCEVPVIFESRVAAGLLRNLLECVNGYALYRKASFLAGRLGDAIASELVSVVDDGRRPGGLGSRPFDGEGLPTRRNVIIDAGRLESYLLDSYSARRLGASSTGSAIPLGPTGAAAGPTNLWLEPGDASLEDLVADTGRGLLVTEMMGRGLNPVTGDYSRGAAGLWIENGELTHAVQEVTVAGNLGEMLRSIDAIANDLQWLSSVASPSLRVARMTVAGA